MIKYDFQIKKGLFQQPKLNTAEATAAGTMAKPIQTEGSLWTSANISGLST